MLSPSFNDRLIARTRLSGIGRRPDRLVVLRSPAMILSRIKDRSSSANTPSIPNMAQPALVHRGERFHVDTFYLYSAKARASFVKQAGLELGEAEEPLKHDLGRVLLKVEALQEAEITTALAKDDKPVMSDADRKDALALLRSPDLISRITADFATCSMVGEEINLLVGYLACVSRLLDRPLAVIIQSSSAAGKSSLMDAVLALMPSDAQVRYSAMTGQSLFYMGETNLKHLA